MKIDRLTQPNDYTFKIEPDKEDTLLYAFVMADYAALFKKIAEPFQVNGKDVTNREAIMKLRQIRYLTGTKEMTQIKESEDSLQIRFSDQSLFEWDKDHVTYTFA
jgi:hypothetical protein